MLQQVVFNRCYDGRLIIVVASGGRSGVGRQESTAINLVSMCLVSKRVLTACIDDDVVSTEIVI